MLVFEKLRTWPTRQWQPLTEKELNRKYAVDEGVLCRHDLPGQWPDVFPLAEAHKEIGSPVEFSALEGGSIIRYRVVD